MRQLHSCRFYPLLLKEEEGWRVATGWWVAEGMSKSVWFHKYTTPPFGHPSSFHEEGRFIMFGLLYFR